MNKTNNQKPATSNVFKAAIAAIFAITLGVTISFLHTDATMVMLIHYNESGKETNRTPVRMNHNGWPTAELSSEGCEKIWTSLVATPLRVDGFKIHADYYAELEDNENNYWCRYSLSSGVYFDYFPASGTVSDLND